MRHRRDCNGCTEKIGMLEQAVETHEAAVAPTPYPDLTAVDIRSLGQRSSGGRLVSRLHNTQLPVDRFSPGTAEWRRRSVVIDAGDEEPFLGQQEVQQIV